MTIMTIDSATVVRAVALANQAPSVHNSQPWRWLRGQHSLHLYADLRRWLPATDHEGRDLAMSCGAVLHHARVALAAAGIAARVHREPNPDEADHFAAIELRRDGSPEADLGPAAAIPRRRSDRRPFGAWPVPGAFLAELAAVAAAQGAQLRTVSDPGARARLIRAIQAAAQAQDQLPGYQTEIAVWSGLRASEDGIPAANLPRGPAPGAPAARRFAQGDIQAPAEAVDGAELLVIGTSSDDVLCQLRAGEALSAVLLRATELGLASCPLSQPLEVADTRRRIAEQVLDASLAPQILVRVGWAPPGPGLPATPRRPVADTIDILDR